MIQPIKKTNVTDVQYIDFNSKIQKNYEEVDTRSRKSKTEADSISQKRCID